MSRTACWYRSLVRGKLKQESSLTVGGSTPAPGDPDAVCARDGLGRLILPGTGLAGALIQTAARVHPELFDRDAKGPWSRITGKRAGGPAATLFQSLWRFRPARREGDESELRQGVGILQETGAAAAEAGALYDMETLPPGDAWSFFLDIDSRRGGPEVEALALLALAEWADGRCWLGAGAARGLGWMTLIDCEVLRLPFTREAVGAWPDSSRSLDEVWADLKKLPDVDHHSPADLRDLASGAMPETNSPWRYVEIRGEIVAGARPDGYGIDALSVGGHASGSLKPPRGDHMLRPRGVVQETFDAAYDPDIALATTEGRPFIPGSGVRGPLRHAAGRGLRGRGEDVIDPNTRDARNAPLDGLDPVAKLFGLVSRDGRLLASDARAKEQMTLACFQHHAEDEFAGSVFGSGKFDRPMILDGRFPFRLVLEADEGEIEEHLKALAPALGLAELGFVPVGGAKTRGAGGGAWQIVSTRFAVAGRPWEEERDRRDPGDRRSRLGPRSGGSRMSVTLKTVHGRDARSPRVLLPELLKERGPLPRHVWAEPTPTKARLADFPGWWSGEDARMIDHWPAIDEAKLLWPGATLTLLADGDATRWAWRSTGKPLPAGLEARAPEIAIEVDRIATTVVLRRDWVRYGVNRPAALPESLRVVEYRDGARLACWTLDEDPAAEG